MTAEDTNKLPADLLQDILEAASDAIISMDERQRIIFFNRQAEITFGYQSHEVIGRPLGVLLPARFREDHKRSVEGFAAEDVNRRYMNQREGVSLIGLRKNGEEFHGEVTISKLDLGGRRIFTAIVRDITERKRSEEMIKRLAYYDSLTNLPNRTLLQDRLQQAILAGQRENKSVALLLMDLDHFKEINDTLGHQRGDVLLQQVGSRLQGALRPSDVVARLGGDEFAVVLPLAGSEDAALVADKILKALEPPFVIEGLPVMVEASIGLALYPDHGANAESLMQRADVAMYAAKQGGIGYIIYDTKIDQYSPRRLALMAELRQAIEGDQLFLHYQPRIDLQTRRIIGVEALVRWQHPQHGLIPPDQFIAPAEKTGLIKPLTLWVFNTAKRQHLAWHQAGMELPVSVNLSARNLLDPKLPDHIADMLQADNLLQGCLELEVTESTVMADPVRAIEVLTRLRAMKIYFSIDDFGTGYSSLAYLKKLPVDSIKVDKSFVIGMMRDEGNAAIVRATINLGHHLGLKVVAEGVEDKETLDCLIALGCDAAQGYYMCRPLPVPELTRWLNESPWGLKRE